MRKIMNMDTRTWRESFTVFGIVAAYFVVAILSVKLFQWTTTLSNTSQAVFKWDHHRARVVRRCGRSENDPAVVSRR